MGSTTVLEAAARPAVRRPSPADAAAVAAMVERCSRRTRQRRFQGATATIPRAYLARVCEPEPGDFHLAVTVGRRVVALASLCDGELGLLVEDEWQEEGLGTVLLGRLLARAGGDVVAEVGQGNDRVLGWLRRLRPRLVAPQPDGWRVVLDPAETLAALRPELEAA